MLGSILRRPSVIVLCGVNLVITIGYGLIMPILPFYAQSMGATATQLGLLFASYSATQFLFSPFWGRFSDRRGRRPAILLGTVGFALSSVVFGLAKSLPLLFVARLLGGGLACAAAPASMAYMADMTSDEERGDGMAILASTTGLGIFLGPVVGGYLGEIRIDLPFFASAAVTLLIAVAALLLLPESRAMGDPRSTLGTVPHISDVPGARGLQSLAKPLGFLLILTLGINFASAILEGTFGLFLEAKLGFGGRELGLAWGTAGAAMVLTQVLLVGPVMRKYGEWFMILVGLLANALAYTLLLIMRNLADLLLVMAALAILGSGMRPAISTLFSKLTSPQDQGFIQGEQNRFMALGRIFGPSAGGVIFDLSGSSSPYLFGAAIYLGFLVASAFVSRRHLASEKQPMSPL